MSVIYKPRSVGVSAAPPRGHRRRHQAGAHPIAKAIAIQQMASNLRTVKLALYTLVDGEPARKVLAHLAWLVGIGSEVAANLTPGTPEAKRLHAALRTVVHMSEQGGLWQANQAPTLELALQASQALILAHPNAALQVAPGAQFLCSLVERGKATLANVAGAELYQSTNPEGGTRCP